MIECRRAVPADARLLAATRHIVWQETYRGIYPDEKLDHYDLDRYSRADAAGIGDLRHRYFLFMDGSVCAGFFSYGPYNYGTYKDFVLCLNHLYIRKEYQRQGLGKQAFDSLKTFCKTNGIGKFFCGCNAHNHPAIAFYRHMGGVQGDFPEYNKNKTDDIIHFEFYLGV